MERERASTIEDDVSKSGTLLKKSKSFLKSGWREKFFVLSGSSLYYYDKQSENAAQGVVQLQHCKIVTDIPSEKRKFVIALVSTEKTFYLSCKTQVDFDEWLAAITSGVKLSPTPPPEKSATKKKGSKVSNLVDTATNFGASRKMIKELITPETTTIMTAIKTFVTKYENEETAEQLETIAIQLGVKVAILYKEKKVTKAYFMAAIEPLHKLSGLVIDGYEIPFSFSAEEVKHSLLNVSNVLEKMLKPHFNEKTMLSLKELIGYFANEALLNDFFAKKKWKETGLVGETLRELWDKNQV